MNQNLIDKQTLKSKKCPDCGNNIRRNITGTDFPWCEYCDVFFTIEEMSNSIWVVRNENAKQYNQDVPRDYYEDKDGGMSWW